MDNCFTSFRLLTHLEVNNIRATGVLNKNRLRKYIIIGDKQLEEKGTLSLWAVQRTSAKKQKSSVTCVVD